MLSVTLKMFPVQSCISMHHYECMWSQQPSETSTLSCISCLQQLHVKGGLDRSSVISWARWSTVAQEREVFSRALVRAQRVFDLYLPFHPYKPRAQTVIDIVGLQQRKVEAVWLQRCLATVICWMMTKQEYEKNSNVTATNRFPETR